MVCSARRRRRYFNQPYLRDLATAAVAAQTRFAVPGQGQFPCPGGRRWNCKFNWLERNGLGDVGMQFNLFAGLQTNLPLGIVAPIYHSEPVARLCFQSRIM